MSIDELYQRYRASGYAATAHAPAVHADELFYLAVLAFGENALADAARFAAAAAAREPDGLLYAAAATYLARLERAGKSSVYLSPEGFGAFVRAGGNVPLYAATSAALRNVYARTGAQRLLDIGVGDGLALLPALTDGITELDLIEPSAAMLASTCQQLDERGRQHRAFNGTLQEFAAQSTGRWDIAEATFSLQSLMPEERAPMLAWLRARCRRLLIAEFDAPEFAEQFAPARVRYVAEHFERGLGEYPENRELVAQGFLMPVMFGYFDRTAARTNYEQPIAAWAGQLRAAGFAQVTTTELYPYWWAPAYLIEAW